MHLMYPIYIGGERSTQTEDNAVLLSEREPGMTLRMFLEPGISLTLEVRQA
jgi:hypothetical protein